MGRGAETTAKYELDRARREPNETLAKYADRLEKLGSKIWMVPFDANMAERRKIEKEKDTRIREAFRLGLDKDMMSYLGGRDKNDINGMLAVAIKYESDLKVNKLKTSRNQAANGERETSEGGGLSTNIWEPTQQP